MNLSYLWFATGLVIAVCVGCNGCRKKAEPHHMQIYDTLPAGSERTVKLRPDMVLGKLSTKDLNGICSALGRTPKVAYEMQAIAWFPDTNFPTAVCVRVDGFLLFMCLGLDDKWHVYRTAHIVVDDLPRTNRIRY